MGQAADPKTEREECNQARRDTQLERCRPLEHQIRYERDRGSQRERQERAETGCERRSDRTLVKPDLLEDEQPGRLLRALEDPVDEVPRLIGLEAAPDVDVGQDPTLLLRRLAELEALELELIVEQLALRLDRDIFTDAHAECPSKKPCDACKDDDTGRSSGTRHSHHEGKIADEPVVGAEYDRS